MCFLPLKRNHNLNRCSLSAPKKSLRSLVESLHVFEPLENLLHRDTYQCFHTRHKKEPHNMKLMRVLRSHCFCWHVITGRINSWRCCKLTVWCILPSPDSIKRIKPAIRACVPTQASDRHFLTMHNGPLFRGKLNHRLHIKKKKAHFKITSPLVESVLFAYFSIKVARGSR